MLLVFVALFIFWRKRRVEVFLLAGAVFWLLGSWLAAPMIRLAQFGYDTTQWPHLAPRMAIIVLGGGTEYDSTNCLVSYGDSLARIDIAAAIYKRCEQTGRACQIIMSGGNPQHHEESEADLYGRLFLDAGVKRSDLILENQSLDTYENARNTYDLLKSREYDTTALVARDLIATYAACVARLRCIRPSSTACRGFRAKSKILARASSGRLDRFK